jgi:hypothetical protein
MLHLQELEKDLEGKTNLVGIVGRKGYSKLFWYRLHERLVTIQVQLLVMLHDLFSVQQKNLPWFIWKIFCHASLALKTAETVFMVFSGTNYNLLQK